MLGGEKIVLTILTPMKTLKDIAITPTNENFYPKYSISKNPNATKEDKEFFLSWLKREFEEQKVKSNIE